MGYTAADTAHVLLALGLLIAAAHGGGFLLTRLHQPRVVGEILGGVVLGPTVLGLIAPGWSTWIVHGRSVTPVVLGAAYQTGLLLLMFVSGTEMRRTFERGERKTALWITLVGTALPFFGGLLFLEWSGAGRFLGTAQHATAFLLIFACAMAVTSIPVISRIMLDLGIIGTPFARIVLSSAVLEDVVLYAILAVALGLVGGPLEQVVGLPALLGIQHDPGRSTLYHIVATLAFFGIALTLGPRTFRRAARSRWNVVQRSSPVAFRLTVVLLLSGLGLLIGVAPLFGAFVAGLIAAPDDAESEQATGAIRQFAFASLVPIYFAIVGLRLNLAQGVDVGFFLLLLAWASAVKAASVYAGARLAGEQSRGARNLAVALNCRGGPGIVLASVAFDAGIINEAFYAMLVMLALITSVAAGSWLEIVVRRGAALR